MSKFGCILAITVIDKYDNKHTENGYVFIYINFMKIERTIKIDFKHLQRW